MNGKTLKERIAQLSNMTYTDIAKRLNVSEQSMYQYFLVNDVKSGLIERNDLHIGKDTINEALNHVDSTMEVTDTYIRKSFDNLNEANRKVVDYIVGLKLA